MGLQGRWTQLGVQDALAGLQDKTGRQADRQQNGKLGAKRGQAPQALSGEKTPKGSVPKVNLCGRAAYRL